MKSNLKTRLGLEVCWTSEVQADEAAERVRRDGSSGPDQTNGLSVHNGPILAKASPGREAGSRIRRCSLS